ETGAHCRGVSSFELDAFRDEIDREPLGNKEDDRIGKSLRDDSSPGLVQLQQVPPSRTSRILFGNTFALVRHDQLQLFPAKAMMYLRWVIQPSPDNQPEESQRARDHECRPPSPAAVNPQNDEWSDCAPDRRTTVSKRGGYRALALRK